MGGPLTPYFLEINVVGGNYGGAPNPVFSRKKVFKAFLSKKVYRSLKIKRYAHDIIEDNTSS